MSEKAGDVATRGQQSGWDLLRIRYWQSGLQIELNFQIPDWIKNSNSIPTSSSNLAPEYFCFFKLF